VFFVLSDFFDGITKPRPTQVSDKSGMLRVSECEKQPETWLVEEAPSQGPGKNARVLSDVRFRVGVEVAILRTFDKTV
jgi:hypothetical protein